MKRDVSPGRIRSDSEIKVRRTAAVLVFLVGCGEGVRLTRTAEPTVPPPRVVVSVPPPIVTTTTIEVGVRADHRVEPTAVAQPSRPTLENPLSTPVDWSDCRPKGEPILLREDHAGDPPDVAFDGYYVMVVSRGDLQSTLQEISPSGNIDHRIELGPIDRPRITWSAQKQKGLIVGSTPGHMTFHRIDVGGAPMFPAERIPTREGFEFCGDVAPTEDGFLISASDPSGLVTAHITDDGWQAFDRRFEPPQWRAVRAGMPLDCAEHGRDDHGMASGVGSMATDRWWLELTALDEDGEPVNHFSSHNPTQRLDGLLSLERTEHSLLAMLATEDTTGTGLRSATLVNVPLTGDIEQWHRLGVAPRGDSARIGDAIVVAAPRFEHGADVVLFGIDPNTGIPTDFSIRIEGMDPQARAGDMRIVETNDGFALVWTLDQQVWVQLASCDA